MNGRHLLLGMLLASTTACGPRIGQWVQVTDCAQKHVVVPGVKLRIEDIPGVGVPAQGGATDAAGNTWGGFPVEDDSHIMPYFHGEEGKAPSEKYRHPKVAVPANPTQPIYACVNR